MSYKKYLTATLLLLAAVLIFISGFVIYVDPYFHYHGINNGLSYLIDSERYQNDGIGKHFDYDAIITGTSMAENFKTSELDELFGVNSVKLCYSGASFKETGDSLAGALDANGSVKLVVRCLDYYKFAQDKDYMEYDSYPDYLYDKNAINDVRYLLDKNIITRCIDTIKYTKAGNQTTNFDDYSSWSHMYEFSKSAVLSHYTRTETCAEVQKEFSEGYAKANEATINQNVLNTVKAYPNTQFYFYFPPYSIAAWDGIYRVGNMQIVMEEQRYIGKMLLQYDNVHLFVFLDEYDYICNLDNYMDTSHYGPEMNSYILQCMAAGEHEITLDNIDEYCDRVSQFYLNYDYDAIFN